MAIVRSATGYFDFFFPWRAVASGEGWFLADARRSIFLRRTARFLMLSLPRLCPISFDSRLLNAPSQRS